MTDQEKPKDLDALDARIKAMKGGDEVKHHTEEHYSQANLAWRMVTEMVAGLLIGFGIGYGLDRLLGTTPWLMIVFILLGFAAGVNVMLRSAKEIQAKKLADEAGENEG